MPFILGEGGDQKKKACINTLSSTFLQQKTTLLMIKLHLCQGSKSAMRRIHSPNELYSSRKTIQPQICKSR